MTYGALSGSYFSEKRNRFLGWNLLGSVVQKNFISMWRRNNIVKHDVDQHVVQYLSLFNRFAGSESCLFFFASWISLLHALVPILLCNLIISSKDIVNKSVHQQRRGNCKNVKVSEKLIVFQLHFQTSFIWICVKSPHLVWAQPWWSWGRFAYSIFGYMNPLVLSCQFSLSQNPHVDHHLRLCFPHPRLLR